MRSAAAYLRAAKRRLEALDFDGDEANLLVVAPLRSRLRPAYRRAVLELDWSLEQKETSEGLALKGKAFSFLGEYENAEAALDRALELDPAAERARV
jgi:tetratricopeptide (TPR) repeat protein